MSVPKRKTSKSKRDMRQSGKGLVKKNNLYINDKGDLCMSHMKLKVKVKNKEKNKKDDEKE